MESNKIHQEDLPKGNAYTAQHPYLLNSVLYASKENCTKDNSGT